MRSASAHSRLRSGGGQSLDARELVGNEGELRLEVATEFWRAQSRDEAGARTLAALAPGPEKLAARLRVLLEVDAIEPPLPPDDAAADANLSSSCDALAELATSHGEEARELLRLAARSGSVNRQRSADEKVDAVWRTLGGWLLGRDDALLHPTCSGTAAGKLRSSGSRSMVRCRARHVRRDQAWIDASSAVQRRRREGLAMLHRLREFGGARIAQLKRERGLVGYADLVDDVARALAADADGAFAARLQRQFRIALVDEFQDTDPRQSAIFHRLFAQRAEEDETGAARALFLIGDPKQAIYRFRGGDIDAYLVAAHRAHERHSLQRNFRSRPSVLTTSMRSTARRRRCLRASWHHVPFGIAGRSLPRTTTSCATGRWHQP